MKNYILKRSFSAFITIIVVFTINFIIINIAPGNPIKTMMGKETDNIEQTKALEEKYGLNKPLYEQYFRYLKNISTGDLGISIIYNKPVAKMILDKIGPTILLVLTSAIISLFLGTGYGYSSCPERRRIY